MGNTWGRPEGAAQRAAVQLLEDVIDQRRFEQVRRSRASQTTLPKEWADASRADDYAFWVTPGEAARLGREIENLLAPYQQRTFDGERPEGSRRTTWLVYGFPAATDA